MLKEIPGDSWNYNEAQVQLVKVANDRRLHGVDRQLFAKRASARLLHELPRALELVKPGEDLIHLFALGADEAFSSNRNGDCWPCAECEAQHHTFEKYAWLYRNHLNTDPLRSYGRVVKSAFELPMMRIELLVSLNRTKEAAARYGNMVADHELEALAKNGSFGVSMSCTVPYDVCSYCGNRAPTTKQYCDGIEYGGQCKAGGLKRSMGSLVEIDGGIHQLRAKNVQSRFFDISHIEAPGRPADRIAYVTGLIEKAAAERRLIKGAELAEALHLTMPMALHLDHYIPARVQKLLKAAYAAARVEAQLASDCVDSDTLAVSPRAQLAEHAPPADHHEKMGSWLRAMTDRRVCLPVHAFLEFFAELPRAKAAEAAVLVQRELPGIYTRWTSRDDLPALLSRSPYTPANNTDDHFDRWASKCAGDWSLQSAVIERRIRLAGAQQIPMFSLQKVAAAPCDNDAAAKLAEQYALYKLGFLAEIPEASQESQLTLRLAVLQNHVPYAA